MKVAIVSPAHHPRDPIAHYALSLISYLKEYGLNIYFFSKRKLKDLPPQVHFFESFNVPKAPLYSLLEDLRREGPFDVIEFLFSPFYVPCVGRTLEVFEAIRKEAGPLLIKTFDVIHPRYDEYLNKFQIKLAEKCDALLIDHDAQFVELTAEGVPEDKIVKIPMGSDYYPRSSRRKRFFLGVDWRNLSVISYYGPISKEIPLLDAIKGVELARKEREDIFLLISGYSPRSLDISSFEMIKGECDKQRWAKVLYREPEIWEVHEIYSISCAVLFPFVDPPGIVRVCPYLHLELYSGTPPIFPMGIRYMEILPKASPFSYRPGDVRGIAEAILRAVEVKKPLQFMRRISKEKSWERVSKDHLKIYEQLSEESQL